MKILKKLGCCLLSAMLCMSVVSCSRGTGTGSTGGGPEDDPPPTDRVEEYSFSTVFLDGVEKTLDVYSEDTAHEDGCVTFNVSSRIGDKNYLKFEIATDVDLVGYINYYSTEDSVVTNSEKFFIKAGSKQFTTFLDAFREGANGAFSKVISTVSFQSVDDTKEGKFTFKSLGVSDRTLDTHEQWTITNGDMVLGTSAFYGGSITYLEKLDQDVYEYIDFNGDMVIDRYVDPDYDAAEVVSDKVNFVNIYDLGREIQPSYYSGVGPANGYDPKYEPDEVYQGNTADPLYNPIQCGDYGGHSPQIIDYTLKEDYLYIKMKAQEWFFTKNIQANGYIEVTYSFDEGGALLVDNSYTDFSCFKGEWSLGALTQETPATYFVYPLNYFYCETKQGTIYDNNVSSISSGHEAKTSKNSNVSGDYYYNIGNKYMQNDWCAFVNENRFGVGIYMPNADTYFASRGVKSNNYYRYDANRRYVDKFFNFSADEIVPSYAAANYNYVCPGVNRKMVDFVTLSYGYALYIGDTDEMRSVFTTLDNNGTISNSSLADTESSWPKK